ncbi:GH1 family beta-glucosidase [Saccharomonospora glauca]|uniref:Beta-glucosidase n=1 Tax=Saccharomonospora glauca K62 TaxID=928724 RepID=I1D3B4_9PSEU|nr:GH1 family beta-glucosidase [Saccharomonospora glauca]EIE99438.1 beta-galactosidase [Saccharomonospora glauca K62]
MSAVGTQGTVRFPEGFLWGVATAAFQVEGSTTADGRSPSIWDAFCEKEGAVAGGDTGEPATDHYRRMPADVALMRDLGIRAYRFSVAWPRVRPDGGEVNPAGLDFYERLVDTLLEAGIKPWPTLYHWDLPQALEERGGWPSREVAHRFADYAEAVVDRLGDRVSTWTTLNEPWCSAFLGYGSGRHAPGRRDPRAAVAAAHHLLLAHGLGTAAVRARVPDAEVGVTLNLFPVNVADPDDPGDAEVARRVDGLQNRLFLDPVLRARYPEDVVADLEPFGFTDVVRDGDEAVIGASLDFLGVNYYRDLYVSSAPEHARPMPEWVGVERVSFPKRGLPQTASGWDVNAGELTGLLLRLHTEYPRLPLYITENGVAFPDDREVDGRIDDTDRIAFVEGHLRAAHSALEQGVDLRGYFYWSLLDNFEWAEGYAKRFGLVHVDYETQRRTPKASAAWYSRVIADNGLAGRR